ncbi:hypothetical protein V8G54_024438 [Vigna mungo]|uniref:Uncharacterized protein n=1 Tax=Vigna mungo TaxID=3915 RepID=A0AAQ3RRB0_VIGMU
MKKLLMGSENTTLCLSNQNSISLFCLLMRPKQFGLLSIDSNEPNSHATSPTVTSTNFNKVLGPLLFVPKWDPSPLLSPSLLVCTPSSTSSSPPFRASLATPHG